MEHLDEIVDLEIEPLSDELLNAVAGASSTGVTCCSCAHCSGCASGTCPPTADRPVGAR